MGDVVPRGSSSSARVRTTLDAKIWSKKDFSLGIVEYRLFPRQVRQLASAEVVVLHNDASYSLTEYRPGWYTPLWMLDGEQLSSGLNLPIRSANSPLQYLSLPARDFWVLTLDPEVPDSGIHASWDQEIEIGSTFQILARETLRSDLLKLRNEGLLEWESITNIFDGWEEYRGVTVQSEPQAWTSLTLENDSLRLTLQPRTTFSVGFVGGLRAPRGTGWFVQYGPQISLASFIPDAELAVYTENEELIFSGAIEAGQLVDIPWGGAGNYKVIVTQNGHPDERVVRILDWMNIEYRLLDFEQLAHDAHLSFFGAIVRDH